MVTQSNHDNKRWNEQRSKQQDEVSANEAFEDITTAMDSEDTVLPAAEQQQYGQNAGGKVALSACPSPAEQALPRTSSRLSCAPTNANRNTLWQRLKWGLALSMGGTRSFSYVSGGELKTAIAATLEAALMGSALVLTVSLQIQEVVGGRGGFNSSGGNALARNVFIVASALSFALCFFSIVTSFVLLLELSSYPSRHAEVLLREMWGWLNAPKICTFAAGLCLAVSALTGNFLGLERTAALLGTSILVVGLVVALGVIPVVIANSRKIREESLASVVETLADHEQRREPNRRANKTTHDLDDTAHLNTSVGAKRIQPLFSPLSSGSTPAGVTFRVSGLPL